MTHKTIYAAERFRGTHPVGQTSPSAQSMPETSQPPQVAAGVSPQASRHEPCGLQDRLAEIRKGLSTIRRLMNELKARDVRHEPSGGEP